MIINKIFAHLNNFKLLEKKMFRMVSHLLLMKRNYRDCIKKINNKCCPDCKIMKLIN